MGNQQATLSDWKVGWLVGILDGDGSFRLVERKTKKRRVILQ